MDNPMYFSEDQTLRLDARIRQLEKNTGIELVTAVVGKCDHYPEIPWKAFALGVAFGALVIVVQGMLRPDWLSAYSALIHTLLVLGAGTVMALLTVFWPAWARCFLDKPRAEAEIRQYAQSVFLEHEIFKVPARTGMLLLVGLFERRVVILPDSGVGRRLSPEALRPVIAAMRGDLKRGDRLQALTNGMSVLEEQLKAAGFVSAVADTDRIPDALIQRKGDADA
jgi:putative membrane protein